MAYYSPAEAARIAQVAPSSIRNYTRDPRFRSHFSATATPQGGKARQLTANDVKLVRFIAQATGAGQTLDEAAERLQAGELDAVDWHPPELEAGPQQQPLQQQQTSLVLATMLTQLERYQDRESDLHRQIAELQRQVGQLEGEVRVLRRPWWRRLLGG